MPSLLQINVEVNTGSTGRIAEEIGTTVIEKGWSSYIAYGRNPMPSKSHTIRIGSDLDVKLHVLNTRLFDNHGFGSVNATKSLVHEIENIHPDIIHLHNIHGYYINVEILFNYLCQSNIPVVWTLHDCWSMTGHCSHFDFVKCNKWETECNNCPNLRGYPSTKFFDRSSHNFYKKKKIFTSYNNITIVTPSVWLKDIVQHSFLKNFRVEVINNGINLSVFRPCGSKNIRKIYGIPENKNIIIGVASVWNERKGLDDFIELSKMLDDNEIVCLVGLKKEQLKRIPEKIIGIERTENTSQLAALYSLADVFVNPTWVDTFPTTNIEAMACGTPVVTYRTGGSPESVIKETGLVVDKGNVSALYKAIKNIENIGKDMYSEACRDRAIKNYNKDDRFNDYYNLYKSLIHVY